MIPFALINHTINKSYQSLGISSGSVLMPSFTIIVYGGRYCIDAILLAFTFIISSIFFRSLLEDLQPSMLPLYSWSIFTYVINCFLFSPDKLLYNFTNSCSSRAYCSMLSRSSINSVIDIPS